MLTRDQSYFPAVVVSRARLVLAWFPSIDEGAEGEAGPTVPKCPPLKWPWRLSCSCPLPGRVIVGTVFFSSLRNAGGT